MNGQKTDGDEGEMRSKRGGKVEETGPLQGDAEEG